MSRDDTIGLHALHSITWYVNEPSRTRELLNGALGFRQCERRSSIEADDASETSVVYEAGRCRIACVTPRSPDSRAAHYLRQHPSGIGRVTFEVDDLARAQAQLSSRGATFVSSHAGASANVLEVTTPIDDLVFGFVQRSLDQAQQVGSGIRPDAHAGPSHFDHITINTGTILPVSLWLTHLLGLEKHWEIEFHTAGDSANPDDTRGSGLKSSVLWDRHSGVQLALNEPKRPNFFGSQIELFRRDHRGSGIQHVALHVTDLVGVVRALRARGVRFAPIPGPYYEQLQARLDRIGVGAIDEPLDALRELGILVDGSGRGRYLLQIFIEDEAGFLGDNDRSPFFLELIERKGCTEFGAGNFRALFDSIAAAQERRTIAP